jgi:hypothetical protein
MWPSKLAQTWTVTGETFTVQGETLTAMRPFAQP